MQKFSGISIPSFASMGVEEEHDAVASGMEEVVELEPPILIGQFFKSLLYELLPPVVQLFVIFPLEMLLFRRSFYQVCTFVRNKMHVPRLLAPLDRGVKILSVASNLSFLSL